MMDGPTGKHTTPSDYCARLLFRYLAQRKESMTLRTRALYSFGESPQRDLQLINRAVNPQWNVPTMLRPASARGVRQTQCFIC